MQDVTPGPFFKERECLSPICPIPGIHDCSYRSTPFIRYVTEKLRGREKGKGIKNKMRVKLAAKMLIITWTLMKKREEFDPKYLAID